VGRDARGGEAHDGDRRVPDGREARLDVERFLVLELELLELEDLGEQARVVQGVAQGPEGEDRVDDRREDRAEPVALDEALVDPPLPPVERPFPPGQPAHPPPPLPHPPPDPPTPPPPTPPH